MGQKVNPISLRLQLTNREFDSNWYNNYYYRKLVSRDIYLQQYINSFLNHIKCPEPRISIQYTQKNSKLFTFLCYPKYSREIRSRMFGLANKSFSNLKSKRKNNLKFNLKNNKKLQYSYSSYYFKSLTSTPTTPTTTPTTPKYTQYKSSKSSNSSNNQLLLNFLKNTRSTINLLKNRTTNSNNTKISNLSSIVNNSNIFQKNLRNNNINGVKTTTLTLLKKRNNEYKNEYKTNFLRCFLLYYMLSAQYNRNILLKSSSNDYNISNDSNLNRNITTFSTPTNSKSFSNVEIVSIINKLLTQLNPSTLTLLQNKKTTINFLMECNKKKNKKYTSCNFSSYYKYTDPNKYNTISNYSNSNIISNYSNSNSNSNIIKPQQINNLKHKNYVQDFVYSQFNLNTQYVIFHVSQDWQSAGFLADEIVYFIEKRVAFRRLKHKIIQKIAENSAIRGVRIQYSGRVGAQSKKAQRAKTESVKYGQTSRHTFSSKIDFAIRTARTPFGSVGIKVWICYN